jgi:23S rRNA (guanosine2251-2'-O)-methyltransferase
MSPVEVQLEGRRPVMEALRAGRPLRKILVSRAASGSGALHGLLGEARRRGIPVQVVDPAVLHRLAGPRNAQGVIAYAAAHAAVDLEDLLAYARARAEPAIIVVLDGIEDPRNLGAILRSAESAGAHGVVIPRRRAAGLSPAVAAASAGAIEHIRVALVASIAAAVDRLRSLGVWVVGADPASGEDLFAAELEPPLALVLGSEGRGISHLVRGRCDRLVRIPMYGRTASLNVAVAAGVLLFEMRRQMHRRRKEAAWAAG